jgi:hypothetical protein
VVVRVAARANAADVRIDRCVHSGKLLAEQTIRFNEADLVTATTFANHAALAWSSPTPAPITDACCCWRNGIGLPAACTTTQDNQHR